MRKFLTIATLCLFSISSLGQSDLPVVLDAKLTSLALGEFHPNIKYRVDGKTGEVIYPDGSSLKAQVDLNPLRSQMLLLRKEISGEAKDFSLTLGQHQT